MTDPKLDSFEAWMQETFGDERDFYPADLREIARTGDLDPPVPTMLRRSDGHHLLYSGKLHWLASEPEAGKSWLAMLAAVEVLRDGGRVVYFDYEMNPHEMTRRLLLLGLAQHRLSQVDYIRPPGKMYNETLQFYGTDTEGAPALFRGADLVVFDACTEAMTADGFDPLSNTDVAAWLRPRPNST